MSILLGLTGKAGSGKDQTFSYIDEWCREKGLIARSRAFADLIKQSFARMFIPDISVEEAVQWFDALKKDSELTIEWGNTSNSGTCTRIKHSLAGRTAIQRFGTEGHRDIFGENFWVDALLPKEGWEENFKGPLYFWDKPPDVCVVTDVRFENEAQRVKDLEGLVWEINRLHYDASNFPHVSERGLTARHIDVVIANSSSVDVLRRNIRRVLELKLNEKLLPSP